MHSKVERSHQGRSKLRKHPFVDGVIEILDKYDGTTNPDEHVTQVNLFTNDDAILCRVFPTSLKGATLNWYMHLPHNSIDSFETPMEKFRAQYATSQPYHLTLVALINMRHEEDESLCSFMEQISIVAIKIKDLNLEVSLHSMIMVGHLRKFVRRVAERGHLEKNQRQTIGEMRTLGEMKSKILNDKSNAPRD
ncbi:hypothetical protein CR513_03535, partial [Mucuna pruriens]